MYKISYKDYALLIIIGVIWGSQFVFNEFALTTTPPLTLAALRILIGVITLTLIVVLFPASEKKDQAPIKHPWRMYCVISLFECVLPFFLVPWGQQHVDSSIAAILMSTVPLFTLLLGSIFTQEKWSFALILSVLFGFVGIVILVGPNLKGNWLTDIVGQMAIVLGSIGFAISILLLKKLPGIPAAIAIRNIMMVSAVPMVILSLIIDKPWELTFTWSSGLSLVMLGVFMAGIVYLLLMVLIKRTSPAFASLSNYLVPLVGVIIGTIFMGEKIGVNTIVALVFILLGLFIARLRPCHR